MNSIKCSFLKRMLLKPGDKSFKGLTYLSVVEGFILKPDAVSSSALLHMAGEGSWMDPALSFLLKLEVTSAESMSSH